MATYEPVTTVFIEGREVELGEGVENVEYTSGEGFTIHWHPRRCSTLDEVIAAGGLIETSR